MTVNGKYIIIIRKEDIKTVKKAVTEKNPLFLYLS